MLINDVKDSLIYVRPVKKISDHQWLYFKRMDKVVCRDAAFLSSGQNRKKP